MYVIGNHWSSNNIVWIFSRYEKMKIKKGNIHYFLGNFENCYVGYSNEEKIRNGAASGGVVTAIVIYLLKKRRIDGVLVSQIEFNNGQINARPFIAKNEKEILDSRTSIYQNPLSVSSDVSNFQTYNNILNLLAYNLKCYNIYAHYS